MKQNGAHSMSKAAKIIDSDETWFAKVAELPRISLKSSLEDGDTIPDPPLRA